MIIVIPDGEKMGQIEDSGYEYLGVIQDCQIRHTEMKEMIRKEYVVKAVNQWVMGVVRYGAGVIDWTKSELKELDRQIRKVMTCNGVLHPRANVARLYLRRKESGRGLITVEDCVISECNSLYEYVANSTEPMLRENSF